MWGSTGLDIIKESMNFAQCQNILKESSHLSMSCVTPQDNDPNHRSRSEMLNNKNESLGVALTTSWRELKRDAEAGPKHFKRVFLPKDQVRILPQWSEILISNYKKCWAAKAMRSIITFKGGNYFYTWMILLLEYFVPWINNINVFCV